MVRARGVPFLGANVISGGSDRKPEWAASRRNTPIKMFDFLGFERKYLLNNYPILN